MSLRLFLNLLLASVLGVLLLVTVGAALQRRELGVHARDVLRPEIQLLESSARMHRLLLDAERGADIQEAFLGELDGADALATTDEQRTLCTEIRAAFTNAWSAEDLDTSAVADAVDALSTSVGESLEHSAEAMRAEAATTAVGLGLLAAIVIVAGVWMLRRFRTTLFERLAAIEQAAAAIQKGEAARRVAIHGDDELAKVARALDLVLDLRERDEAAVRGRNRELRALLVALLRQWPTAAAVTGIDGEIIVSTLSSDEEEILRSLTPEVRVAARTLLSRGFVSAEGLETEIRVRSGHVARLRALAIGDVRIVGWLALFRL